MFLRKKLGLQRLNLETPNPETSLPSIKPPETQSSPRPTIDPAKLEAVNHRAKEILRSGRIPESLFVCGAANRLLTFQPGPGEKPVMLLFSSSYAAADYLRETCTQGTARSLKVEALPQSAQSWMSLGLQATVLDRCPRCPEFLSIDLAGMTKWTKEDFAKIWAHLRATRSVMAETRIRSAMTLLAESSYAAARAELEYVRDHFDCGIPYLHQVIGVLAGMQQDQLAKASAMDRLKEFGAEFEGTLEFSPELVATAMVGLMANFGIAPAGGPK